MVIIVTVAFTLTDAQKKELSTSTQEMWAALGAALTAFFAAVAVSGEAVDEGVGDLVKTKLREKFVYDSDRPGKGQVVIDTQTDAGTKADRALNSSEDYGWTDWSRANRKARVDAIAEYLATGPTRG